MAPAQRADVGPVAVAFGDAAHTDVAASRDALAALGSDQLARADALDGVLAARFVAGRGLLLGLLEELAPGADPEIVTRCARCGGPHGAPRALHAPVAMSVSYAGALVAAAAVRTETASAVGIDVERGDPATTLGDLGALFAPDPPPDLARWTRIEAVLKADGRGIRVAPNEVRERAARSRTLLDGSRIAAIPGRCGTFEVAPVAVPRGVASAVAILRARSR